MKSTIASASSSDGDERRGPAARAPARAPRRPCPPARPLSRIFTRARASDGVTRSSASRNRSSLGPDAGRRQPLRREQRCGELGDRRGLDRVDLGDQPLEREQLRVGDQRLAEPVHARRRRLHREQDRGPSGSPWRALSSRSGTLPAAMSAICSAAIASASARLSSRVPT